MDKFCLIFLHHFSEGHHLVHGVYQERGAFITRYLWGRGKLIDTGHFLESGRLLDLRISPGLCEPRVLLNLGVVGRVVLGR